MGAVYLARDEALERLVAIKVLRGDLAPDAEGRERFRREARTAAQLSHPNIVPLLSFGDVDGLLYLVLGYVTGEPLSARLRREGRLEPEEARRIMADVAEALDYAHRKGVIHRDVKPDNVLLDDETGRAVLTDFGIAKALAGGQTVTRTGGLVGTPLFMSPEQAAGRETLDGRSDIYSLGLLAYTMLAGRPPFEGGAPQEVVLRRLTAEAPPLQQAAPGIPDDLAAAVTRCLRRDPADRWPDARALREAVSPSTLEADHLPEPLDTLDGAGTFLLPFGLAFAAALLWALTSDFEDSQRPTAPRPFALPLAGAVLLAGFVAGQLPMLVSAVRAARARGFLWRQVWGALWRQPEWWMGLWYPRPYRRGGDVWDRLPGPVRAWRVIVTALAADFLAFLYLWLLLGPVVGRFDERVLLAKIGGPRALDALRGFAALVEEAGLPPLLAVSFLLLAAALGVTAVLCALLLRRQGFDTYTLRRVSRALISGPTSKRSPWKGPDVARVLRPAPPPRRPAAARTPREARQAVLAAVARLPAGLRSAAAPATEVAQALVDAVSSQEAALARLARNADPTEAARLRERLAALRESDDPESVPMRELLTRQLALLEEAAERLAAAQAARERGLAALQALWLAVDELARSPADERAALRVKTALDEAGGLLGGPAERTPPEDMPTRQR